jgi:hypothetical protein
MYVVQQLLEFDHFAEFSVSVAELVVVVIITNLLMQNIRKIINARLKVSIVDEAKDRLRTLDLEFDIHFIVRVLNLKINRPSV